MSSTGSPSTVRWSPTCLDPSLQVTFVVVTTVVYFSSLRLTAPTLEDTPNLTRSISLTGFFFLNLRIFIFNSFFTEDPVNYGIEIGNGKHP